MRRALASLSVAAVLVACESRGIDPTDLGSVFEPRPSAQPSADPSGKPNLPALSKPAGSSAASAGSATAVRSPSRSPIAGPCIATAGTPLRHDKRLGKRPACRRSDVREWRDSEGTPRYACVYSPPSATEHAPLPLVLFFHGEHDDPSAVHKKTRLRTRFADLDLSGEPKHPGFVVLAPQARRVGGKLAFDTSYTGKDNLDVVAVDFFVDELLKAERVDPRQIYAVGDAGGGAMAALYALLRPDRVAAYAVYAADASPLVWSCSETPTPAAIFYRACDSVTPCHQIERWIDDREKAGMPTFRMRLGVDHEAEPSCAPSKASCGDRHGTVNHNRWPAKREQEMLEYLARFSLEVK